MGQTTSKNTKNHKNKRKSISKLFHAQTGSIWFQIGSYLVPIGSYRFYSSQIGSYKLKMVSYLFTCHALFQDRFKDVQVGSRWFSTLYILSPNSVHPLTKLSQIPMAGLHTPGSHCTQCNVVVAFITLSFMQCSCK